MTKNYSLGSFACLLYTKSYTDSNYWSTREAVSFSIGFHCAGVVPFPAGVVISSGQGITRYSRCSVKRNSGMRMRLALPRYSLVFNMTKLSSTQVGFNGKPLRKIPSLEWFPETIELKWTEEADSVVPTQMACSSDQRLMGNKYADWIRREDSLEVRIGKPYFRCSQHQVYRFESSKIYKRSVSCHPEAASLIASIIRSFTDF